VLLALVGAHILALHEVGSNNPDGVEIKNTLDAKGHPVDGIPFHPYYTVKDAFGLAVLFLVYAAFLFFAPNFFGEPDNYIPANPLVTPPHIVPEWYFLPYYAILRSIPNKLLGVIAMFSSILVLFILPWLDRSPVRSATFRPIYKWLFWVFLFACVVLGWVGAHRPDDEFHGIPMVVIGRICTLYYFVHFLILVPLIGIFEQPRPLPQSISKPVLRGGGSPATARAKPMEKA